MYKMIIILLITFLLFSSLVFHANAQMMNIGNGMMGTSGTPTVTPTQQDLQDIQTGKNLFDKFQSKQVTCSNLKDDDLEKIGEYVMDQQFGNTGNHIQMNERIKQMMGDQGEKRMHIAIGRSVTDCTTTTNQQGGVTGMMGNWGWTGSMMGGNWFGAFGVFAFLFWLVGFIDLILLGIFLWKRIGRK